ncbi:MAG: serine/threonine protein kinase [Myxococcaceae bacterium]|nr:serine/threonine protein kinase [Myxococcaceae bacterium]
METVPTVNPAALPPGTRVGPWRLVALVAQGSHGLVFRAEHSVHPDMGPCALKLARQPRDPRFAREVELLSRIHHPNVPRLHDAGEWMGPGGTPFPFLVMDWIEGLSLYAWARLQRLSSRQVLRLLAQVARALQAVHEAGGFHRDVKGDNIVVRSADGQALLTDFGSCTWRGAPVLTRQAPHPGTDHYLSPQAQLHQWRYRRHVFTRYEPTPEDDLYALGVTAYRLVAGRYPLIASEPEGEEDDAFSRFPALVPVESLAQLCPELARWIGQMLSEQPSARGSAVELALGLELAAKKAGRTADRPVTPRTAGERAAPEAPPGPVRPPLAWRRWLVPAALSVALAVCLWSQGHAPRGESPGKLAAQEGGAVSLGEAASSAAVSAPEPLPEQAGIGAKVPKNPLPGQRLAPCRRPEVEIQGGCWIPVAGEAPPCVPRTYEWKSSCYWPSFGPPHPATSGEKR